MAAGGVLLIPVVAWQGGAVAWGELSRETWLAIGYLALLSSILAYAAWYWALARSGIARMGSVQFAQPVVGVILAALVLGEGITPALVLAGGAILAGIWLAQRA